MHPQCCFVVFFFIIFFVNLKLNLMWSPTSTPCRLKSFTLSFMQLMQLSIPKPELLLPSGEGWCPPPPSGEQGVIASGRNITVG